MAVHSGGLFYREFKGFPGEQVENRVAEALHGQPVKYLSHG